MDKIAAKAVRAYMDGLAWVYRWGGGREAPSGPQRCTPYLLPCNLRDADSACHVPRGSTTTPLTR